MKQLQGEGIRVSLFIDADEAADRRRCRLAGVPVIELHTGRYAEAEARHEDFARELERIRAGARFGVSRGLKVNAGHGLHYHQCAGRWRPSPISANSISATRSCRTRVFAGFENAVREMKAIMVAARLATRVTA